MIHLYTYCLFPVQFSPILNTKYTSRTFYYRIYHSVNSLKENIFTKKHSILGIGSNPFQISS